MLVRFRAASGTTFAPCCLNGRADSGNTRSDISHTFHPTDHTTSMNSPTESPSQLAQLLGWWQLVSCEVELQESGSRAPMYDSPACGYIVFAPDGRMMTVIEAVDRDPHFADGERPPAWHGMAYTGRYRVAGNRWLTDVDAASIAGWKGTVQERSFRIESDRLHVCSDWCLSPQHGGQTVRARLVWKRQEEAAAARAQERR